ncbi:Vms1p NDAI_0A05600 [Naumovozyma dairenensis CBS 421]|uniref:VLRF1 domain-containing protein n=1 Tax=Naumovozyma dairenensis (strain ATCC 10597 / BCRC 20456 / CBS 421 / NBRC 0211 / NRRL Y-12639) TaxID=1071378 RepID=G0W4H7_NAUDC|nr:hypothetical protein NDAI_0A05600 [Naumovozyma dairenensis CBS 421]CCD22715.1 hypothetical protein NDAI_0A05600 [Naumovozyma dairenensis CBS 421]
MSVKKNDLYVYDLADSILKSLKLMYFDHMLREAENNDVEQTTSKIIQEENEGKKKNISNSFSCSICDTKFTDRPSQRSHYQTSFHIFNVKRSLKDLPCLTLTEFDKLLANNKTSLEGPEASSNSESDSESELEQIDEKKEENVAQSGDMYESSQSFLDESLEAELQKLSAEEADESGSISCLNTKSPQIYLKSSLLQADDVFGIYKALFDSKSISSPLDTLFRWNDDDAGITKISALFMVGGGHFAGAIVSHQRANIKGNAKKQETSFQEQAVQFIEHKTFHRYTTRRKQGGSQSAMDNAKGKANSAGSTLRRYNEAALRTDIQNLLGTWAPYLSKCENIFLRASNVQDKQIFLENNNIKKDDERLKTFPFTTGRPTLGELRKSWCELTYLKKVPKPTPIEVKKLTLNKQTNEDPKTMKHQDAKASSPQEKYTEELIALLKKGRAPLLIAYLKKNKLDVNFLLEPTAKYISTPTLLHYAASHNLKQMVTILLSNMKADPCVKNQSGKTAWDMAKEENVRQSFQIARHSLGEEYTNWADAHVGDPLSREQVDKFNKEAEEAANNEAESIIRKELDAAKERQRLELDKKRGVGNKLDPSGNINIKQNLNSLSPEQRQRLMREQRARAAEARLQKSIAK